MWFLPNATQLGYLIAGDTLLGEMVEMGPHHVSQGVDSFHFLFLKELWQTCT